LVGRRVAYPVGHGSWIAGPWPGGVRRGSRSGQAHDGQLVRCVGFAR
jgi:hypothetical protein